MVTVDPGKTILEAGLAAGLTFLVVDRKTVLKVAKTAISLGMIAQGRTTGLNRLGYDLFDAIGKPFCTGARLTGFENECSGRATR